MDLSESQSSSSHGTQEAPCLIVEDSQKEENLPSTSHKQKMLWEMTALQGDQKLSPVLEQVKNAAVPAKDHGKDKNIGKDTSAECIATVPTTTSPSAVPTTTSPTTIAPPWTITKMPSVPPRNKDSSHSSSNSSMGSVYPISSSSHDLSSTSSLNSSDSGPLVGTKVPLRKGQVKSISTIAKSSEPPLQQPPQTITRPLPSAVVQEKDVEEIALSQEDMFSDAKTETAVTEPSRHWLLGTPSETVASLQLSGQVAVYAYETSASDDGSVNIIQPSPEAYGPVPVIIPSTPTPDVSPDEEPMEVSLEYGDEEPDVVIETQHIGEDPQQQRFEEQMSEEQMRQQGIEEGTKSRSRSAQSVGSQGDEIKIPEWQQAINREEEAAAAKAQASGGSYNSNSSHSTHTSQRCNSQSQPSQCRNSQSQPWPQQSESMEGQHLPIGGTASTNGSAKSRPGSSNKYPIEPPAVPDKAVTESEHVTESSQSRAMTRHLEPAASEPQFSQDLFHPDESTNTGLTQTSEERLENLQGQRPSEPGNIVRSPEEGQQGPSSQQGEDEGASEKPDDWSLHLTPSQGTQSQGMYLSRRSHEGHPDMDLQKGRTEDSDLQSVTIVQDSELIEKAASTGQERTVQQDIDKQRTESEGHEDHSKMSDEVFVRNDRGSNQWDESVQSAPRQTQSVDPSQLSSVGFHLNLPLDSGLRPVKSITPPAFKRKTDRSTRQPRHSTPITEESPEIPHGDTPTGGGNNIQKQPMLTLEEGMESQAQESNDLPRFHLEKLSDAEQLVKTAKESPSKRSNSVFSRVQETKMAAIPKKSSKQLLSNQSSNGESEDPFALPSNVKRKSDGQTSELNIEADPLKSTELNQEEESIIDPDKDPSVPSEEQHVDYHDNSSTIPMVYDEEELLPTKSDEVTVQVVEKTQQKGDQAQKASKTKGHKRGKGSSKKRKKPTQHSEDNETFPAQPPDNNSNVEQPSKQPRVERDPYEWTESQSNKTPTPMKLRTGAKSDILTRRRLHEHDQERGGPSAMETGGNINVGAGTSYEARSYTGGGNEQQGAPPKDSTPAHRANVSPSKQQTPPVDGDHGNNGEDQGSDDSPIDPADTSLPKNDRLVRHVVTSVITRTIISVTRIVKETVTKDGKVIEENNEITTDPVHEEIDKHVEEYYSPSLGSSNNSLTSGSLADISSISTSKSPSETPSLQKLSSSSSAGSNLTKTSSISSISRVDSSVGKLVTSPGSNKTSPNTSKESGTSGTPKIPRSVSFQDDTTGQHLPQTGGDKTDTTSRSREIASKSASTVSERSSLTKSQTLPCSSTEQLPFEHSTRLTRSVTSPTKHKESNKGRKSVFPKSYTAAGKRGLRARGADHTTPEPEERKNRQGVTTDDSEKELEPKQKPQRRRSRSRSGQRSGKRSSVDGQSDNQLVMQTLPTTLPVDPSDEPADPVKPHGDAAVVTGQSASTTGQSSSTTGQSLKSSTGHSSSRTAEILGTPPHDPESPGTDISHGMRPGNRVIAKWQDGHYYAGKIKKSTGDKKHVIEFDDGDIKNIHERDILLREWLSRGQSVLATRADGYSYAGVIVGYFNDIESGEQGYAVETDYDHATQRYSRSSVILTKDQAATLVVSGCSSGPGSATSSSEINLDNIVSGKRARGRFILGPGGSPKGKTRMASEKAPVSPRTPHGDTPHPAAKRKLLSSEPGDRTSSPSPKRRARSLTSGAQSPEFGQNVSPSRRSPRKNPVGSAVVVSPAPSTHALPLSGDRIAVMGPLPTDRTLFKGLGFLITSRSGPRKRLILGRSPSDSTDESAIEDEDDTPLDKCYAAEQIQHGGGKVLQSFDKSQITKCTVYLLSNTCTRTTKYFQALAAGIHCISHIWLRDCVNKNQILDPKSYLLPSGIGLDDRTILEQQPHTTILAGMHIYVVSRMIDKQKMWRSVLLAAGCQVVKKLPVQLMKKGEPPTLLLFDEFLKLGSRKSPDGKSSGNTKSFAGDSSSVGCQ